MTLLTLPLDIRSTQINVVMVIQWVNNSIQIDPGKCVDKMRTVL